MEVIVLWRHDGLDVFIFFFIVPTVRKCFACFLYFRACIAIAVCFILSAFAIASKAVYSLLVDRRPRKVCIWRIIDAASALAIEEVGGGEGGFSYIVNYAYVGVKYFLGVKSQCTILACFFFHGTGTTLIIENGVLNQEIIIRENVSPCRPDN